MVNKRRRNDLWYAVLAALLVVHPLVTDVHAGTQKQYPMGVVGGRMRLLEGTKNVLEITAVHEGAPAKKAGLYEGDKIIAVNGYVFKPGYMTPFRMFGHAIDRARGDSGELELTIHRGGKKKKVIVDLGASKSFTKTYPFDCPKSQAIYNQVCHNLAEQYQRGPLPGGEVTNALAVMALIGHQTGRYDKTVQPYVMKMANKYAGEPDGGGSVWMLSYSGVMMCEYYLLHPDPTIKLAIKNIAQRLAKYIPDHGRYGHHLRPGSVNAIAYGGKGLNATTTAALWFLLSAQRCGIDHAVFKEAFHKAFKRVRAETNAGGGVGYSWPADHQSPMRSGHMGLAMHHLMMSKGLVDTQDRAILEYDRAVGAWPSRHSDHLLEAHAVSSLGIAASTASLAAHQRKLYQQLMQDWKWWFALAWERTPDNHSRYHVAYVGGPNNTGGDYYLNGHRPLHKGFNTIMHATVGFMLASSHERLSFYGGMPAIPGLNYNLMKDDTLRRAYKAIRHRKYTSAMRMLDPLLRQPVLGAGDTSSTTQVQRREEMQKLSRSDAVLSGASALRRQAKPVNKKSRETAQMMYDYADELILAPAFETVRKAMQDQDKHLAQLALQDFAKKARGLTKYKEPIAQMTRSFQTPEMLEFLKIGKQYHGLERFAQYQPQKAVDVIRRFIEKHQGHYYATKAQDLLRHIETPKGGKSP